MQNTCKPRGRTRRLVPALAASAAVVGLAAAGFTYAVAASGGGGGSGSGTGELPSTVTNFIFDDAVQSAAGHPVQGWDQSSIDWFRTRLGKKLGFPLWKPSHEQNVKSMNEACGEALARATQRGHGARARVVGMKVSVVKAAGHHSQWLAGVGAKEFDAVPHDIDNAPGSVELSHYPPAARAQFSKLYEAGYAEGRSMADGHKGIRIVCIAMNSQEPVLETPPPPPVKTITQHVHASQMTNTTTISTETGDGGHALVITDKVEPNGHKYKISNARVMDGANDVSGGFTIAIGPGDNPAITATWKHGVLPAKHTLKLIFDVTIDRSAMTEQTGTFKDTGAVKWNSKPAATTNSEQFQSWSPKPNKAWVLKTGGHWQAVTDKDWSNTVGADDHYFMNGDAVASVVNGIVRSDLAQAPKAFTLTDDYGKARPMLDDSKTGNDARVYRIDASEDLAPSVDDAVTHGEDVTSSFTINKSGTTVTATAKPELLKTMRAMSKSQQYVLLLPFTVKIDTAAWLKTFNKQPSDGLKTCTSKPNDNASAMLNSGNETLNNDKRVTNTPKICVWIPPIDKQVVAAHAMNGKGEPIEGKALTSGQTIEYRMPTTLAVPNTLAQPIKTAQLVDEYNDMFIPNKDSVAVLMNGSALDDNDWTVTWLDSAHKFTIDMSPAWVSKHLAAGANTKLEVRVAGMFRADHANKQTGEEWSTRDVTNTVQLKLNNTVTPGPKRTNPPDPPKPSKDVTASKKSTVSINGYKAYLGDRVFYKLKLDVKPDKPLAYAVQRVGMIDDYDDTYLDVKASDISVLAPDGNDITPKFNVQVKDGKAYIFAKTVDTMRGARQIKGDPQPSDLSKYATMKLDPTQVAAVDQSLVGKVYTIVMPATVKKITSGYVVRNQAAEIFNEDRRNTNTVENPLVPIDPHKDVTVEVNGKSINTKLVQNHHVFLYKLLSSKIVGHRAQKTVSVWQITDKLDTTHDRYTGQWAVYANHDLHIAGKTVKAGSRIDGSRFKQIADKPLFTATFKNGVITIASTDWANKNVFSKQGESDMQWTAYIQVERVMPAKKVLNTLSEKFNNQSAKSNTVWTFTPVQRAALKLVKFDKASGELKGDRNSMQQALTVKRGALTRLVYRIYNVGQVPVSSLKLTDKVTAGHATVIDWKYPASWNGLVLKPGEHVDVEATVKGITDSHEDVGTVTGKPVKPCPDSFGDPFQDTSKGKTAGAPGRKASGQSNQTDSSMAGRTVTKTVEPFGDIKLTYDKHGALKTARIVSTGETLDMSGVDLKRLHNAPAAGTPAAAAAKPVKVCTENTTLTAHDPWHAVPEPAPAMTLAKTGSTGTLAAGAVLLLLGGGMCVAAIRKRSAIG